MSSVEVRLDLWSRSARRTWTTVSATFFSLFQLEKKSSPHIWFFIEKTFIWKTVLLPIPLNKLLCCNSSFLSRHNLTVTTNLNAFGADITYRITKPPSSGIILKDDVPVLSFTALDVFDECIEYRHNNSHAAKGKYIFLQFELSFTPFKTSHM